jgi:hypothetical protein
MRSKRNLAELLSEIMNHPETPTILYNAIGDAICEMSRNVNPDTPDFIEQSLVAYFISGEQKRDESRMVRKDLPDGKNKLVLLNPVSC